MGYALYTQMHTGRQPQRMGLSHSSIAPYDAFPTRDGQMLIGVQNDRGWREPRHGRLGGPGARRRPTVRHQCAARPQSRRVRRRAGRADRAVVDRRAGRAARRRRCPRRADQGRRLTVIDHPQLQARDRWRTIGTEHAQVQALLPPATFADAEAVMGDVPALGEHTRALLVHIGPGRRVGGRSDRPRNRSPAVARQSVQRATAGRAVGASRTAGSHASPERTRTRYQRSLRRSSSAMTAVAPST